ncbi:hypothetical protein B0J13DRAFT_626661 [Dactylonectria estremocensis]|uniref:Uncharacterized protein n=1 Tax=Dactylonectria estremocensis TaxID=1079267 RepID=A0A9P9E6R4_9HYPO|nr:hypothetical protein B0J13DRAFT_626661 [Dactylonectria estremocensis]
MIGDQMFAANNLGVIGHDTVTTFKLFKTLIMTFWIGFMLEFPLSASNKEDGFGMTYWVDRRGDDHLEATDVLRLNFKFPRGGLSSVIKPLENDKIRGSVQVEGEMSVVEVCLKDGAEVDVDGFDISFANEGKPMHKGFQKPASARVLGDLTLFETLTQCRLNFNVQYPTKNLRDRWNGGRLPKPFTYPYGTVHTWNLERYTEQVLKVFKGPQFKPTCNYDDHNSHMAVVTQSQVQDVFWLHDAAIEIKEIQHRAYFVKKPTGDSSRYYAIVRLHEDFKVCYDAVWRRLTSGRHPLGLVLHDTEKKEPVNGKATIVDHPGSIGAFRVHPLSEHDLVLIVTSLPSTLPVIFEDRTTADAVLEKDIDH